MLSPDLSHLIREEVDLDRVPVVPNPKVSAANWPSKPPALVVSEPTIMVVDDEPINVKVVRKYLQLEGYGDIVTTSDPAEALNLIRLREPDVVLLDIMMPGVSGLEILQQIRDNHRLADLPVIILTASNDQETKNQALVLGATDFLAKPVSASDLVPRVRNAVMLRAHRNQLRGHAVQLEQLITERTAELLAAQRELIHCLARAADYRDNETGRHVIRVGLYAGLIARELRLDRRLVDLIEQAAPLHDMGKIGVPDAILLKPGKLDPEEMEFMQRHCGFGKRIVETMDDPEAALFRRHTDVGAEILRYSGSPVLKVAARIALTHHERWDGTGYPLGLAGEDIPIEGRVVAVADVFDALSSKRVYKPAMPLEKCFTILEESRGTHFDPTVLDAFFTRKAEIVEVQIRHADTE